jgi:transcription elongation factor Elf1
MLPPLVRRCPDCGHIGWSRRFTVVERSPQVVACPSCGHRFETIDNPLLN